MDTFQQPEIGCVMNVKIMKNDVQRSLLTTVSNNHPAAGMAHCLDREDLKKLASGYQESLDLSEICRRSLDMLREVIPKEMKLEVNFSYPGPIIKADAYHIQQVFIQLVTNALESSSEGHGAIHLIAKIVSSTDIPATHRFPLDWQPKGKLYACLEVADKSCGIAEKDIDALFDPFLPRKSNFHSLGLPVVLEVVRAHLGAITVESNVGYGSTFRVFLPMSVEGVAQPTALLAEAREIRAGGTVLIVDDDYLLRELTRMALMCQGFSVLEANDGLEAVEVFRQHQDVIRFVLCDVVMPHMDGWETLEALRRLAPGIPVILSSGYDLKQVMAGDHPELPQVFLKKPYGLTALREAIRQTLKVDLVSNYPGGEYAQPKEVVCME
jgi:two-component system, cell cycle sensor histidine kinase and response regulator CckA